MGDMILQDWHAVMTKKGRQLFQEKIGVTPSVAAPGNTNPCEAAAIS